jgi:hypothetical protein
MSWGSAITTTTANPTSLIQSSSGDVAICEMSGTSIIGGGSIANPGPAWHI